MSGNQSIQIKSTTFVWKRCLISSRITGKTFWWLQKIFCIWRETFNQVWLGGYLNICRYWQCHWPYHNIDLLTCWFAMFSRSNKSVKKRNKRETQRSSVNRAPPRQMFVSIVSYLFPCSSFYNRELLHSDPLQTHTVGRAETSQGPAQPGSSAGKHKVTHLAVWCAIEARWEVRRFLWNSNTHKLCRRGSMATRPQEERHRGVDIKPWQFQVWFLKATAVHLFSNMVSFWSLKDSDTLL